MGIDIGSTTLKVVVLNEEQDIIFGKYVRHYANIPLTLETVLGEALEAVGDLEVAINMTGSAGMGLTGCLGVGFVQEVVATTKILKAKFPEVDAAIELGGEDAKIIYLTNGVEQRMNGTCAGGTGAFIDQMASLLQTDATGLNELAKNHKEIYPIAARCGVFAKTDVQPLLNEGVSKEDVAVSILQAVVVQTISGLSCGRPIRGNIAFLGGPLHFLPELRNRFIETLDLLPGQVIFPENSQLFIAMGAAITAAGEPLSLSEFLKRVKGSDTSRVEDLTRLPALFKNEPERTAFKARHSLETVAREDLSQYMGNAFLGIDAGSTTTKVALIGEAGQLLYSHYGSNEGSPLHSTLKVLKDLYKKIPPTVKIAQSAVTGYGEALLKAALKIDAGEIETVAHYKAANFFLPGVEFILDIGGQDMKCLKVTDSSISSIMLNEACSAGCGSFLDTFAKSMNLKIGEFVEAACQSQNPVDLGSRCTVFMNSRVKQAQKEGAAIGDIAAGLSYSVVQNALYKVIKIRNPKDLGQKIVVQGGTFYNDAVLRAFELSVGQEVIRPDIAGIMGAFGAALISRENFSGAASTLLGLNALEDFSAKSGSARCKLCHNQCLMTVHRFGDGGRYVSGNRCERGAGMGKSIQSHPNLMDWKQKRIFDYPVASNPRRGKIGIPRVLNLYENYPFWATFFGGLGFEVVLSEPSSKPGYEKGMESIPSESACYPAKLVHGHIADLLEKGVPVIFYPSLIYSPKEDAGANNHFNCPVVTSYPEVIRNNMELGNTLYLNPFLPFTDLPKLKQRLYEEFRAFGILKQEIATCVDLAAREQEKFRQEVRLMGEQTLAYLEEHGIKGIVLAGRPYHMDSHINHGIPEMINALGMAVLTEDSISHLGNIKRPLRVLDQWVYHTRLYGAAHFVATRDDLELVQLNSFGCGLDAVTAEQVQEILASHSKIYTSLKIDEGSNLGAARIRLRSLQAAMKEREGKPRLQLDNSYPHLPFTKEMRESYTILSPQMSPIHFEFVQEAFLYSGYNFEILETAEPEVLNQGLKYVNNDACYPAILVIGQLIAALKSGKYDVDKTALMLSQTGGGCRASNYVGFLRKALREAGLEQVPVISLSAQGFEQNPGFKLDVHLLHRAFMGITYGDLLMTTLYRTRPYEAIAGSAHHLYRKWAATCKADLKEAKWSIYQKNIKKIVSEFEALPLQNIQKPRVGLVGEILVKFHPAANNRVVETIESEGGEAVMPGLLDFFLYAAYRADASLMKASGKEKLTSQAIVGLIERYRKPLKQALKASGRFMAPVGIKEIAQGAEQVISLGHKTGEGWLLTGEMVELLEMGVPNIVCMQPFACLPNHITGKGVIKTLRKLYPGANIAAVDYDPGASEVNQLNRIKLMMATAFENLKETTTLEIEHLKGGPTGILDGAKSSQRGRNET